MNAIARPFIVYEEDFDAPPPPPPAAPAAPPLVTQEAVEAARREGYAAGLAAAAQEAAAVRAELHLAILQQIEATLREARAGAAGAAEIWAEETARCMIAALQAALPAAMAAQARGEMETLARRLLPYLAHEPDLVIRTHPDHTPLIEDVLREAAIGARVAADTTLSPGDLRATWTNGEAVRDGARILNAISAALAPLTGAGD